ncbi:MAG: DNA repair protein RadC [Candidatus Nanohaloarchaeota archaeon QJJ-5]|nr:DNA repair protein RadC [Candidatus Nanohaloarchaeota archaeon QJJ-5]
MSQSIRARPSVDRPREKLEQRGRDQLSITELIAVLLGTGGTNQSVLELAGEIVDSMKLSTLRNAEVEELKQFPGVGRAKAATIVAAFELGRRRQHNNIINDVQSARKVLEPRLKDKEQEELHAAFITTSNKVIKSETVFKGTLRSIKIESREIVKRALVLNAAAVVLAHNHPGGDAEPTDADVKTTKNIQTQLALFDINLLDHLVIGSEETTSMKRQDLIADL